MKKMISRKTTNKLKNIVSVIPYEFENILILSLDKQWNTVFDEKISFEVIFDNRGRLCFVSKQCLKK